MPRTLRRSGREPAEGARFWSEVVADNVRALRATFRPTLTHAALAERVKVLGHDWQAHTVADLERGRRTIHVEELGALAVALHATPAELLDPATSEGPTALDVGGGLDALVIEPEVARSWVYGRTRFRLNATRFEPSGWEVLPDDAELPADVLPWSEISPRRLSAGLKASRDRNRTTREIELDEEERS